MTNYDKLRQTTLIGVNKMSKLELNNAINILRKELHDNCMNGGNYNYWEEAELLESLRQYQETVNKGR